MAVFKRKGSTEPSDTFYFKFTLNRKQYLRSAKTTDEREARKREARFRAKLEHEAALPEDERPLPAPPTFGEYARLPTLSFGAGDPGGRFWSGYATAAYASKPNTYNFYLSRVKALLLFKPLAQARLDQIHSGLIQDLDVYFRGRKLKKGGINRNMAALSVVLARAVKENLIREGLSRKSYRVESIGRPITHEEETVYLRHVSDLDHRDYFMILIDSAIEPGVAASLRWEDIVLDPVGKFTRGYIHAVGTKVEGTRERDVPLTTRLNLQLKERKMRAGWPVTGYVFPRPGCTHPTQRDTFRAMHDRMWTRVAPVPIKKFRLYDLRHTCLTRIVEAGGDAFAVQSIAGWASTRMAQVYIKLGSPTRITAMEKLNAHLENTATS